MIFEWDPRKATSNIAKHGVSFTLAQEVWDDPFCAVFPERIVDGEERWQAIGMVGGLAILVVVHSYKSSNDGNVIRIISARRATKHERKNYENEA